MPVIVVDLAGQAKCDRFGTIFKGLQG